MRSLALRPVLQKTFLCLPVEPGPLPPPGCRQRFDHSLPLSGFGRGREFGRLGWMEAPNGEASGQWRGREREEVGEGIKDGVSGESGGG